MQLTAEKFVELVVSLQYALRKNVVISGWTFRFVHVKLEERLELIGVVSLTAWREHILFKELPERSLFPCNRANSFLFGEVNDDLREVNSARFLRYCSMLKNFQLLLDCRH